MKYYDYEWDLEPNRILLDSELNVASLGWKAGDYFRLVTENGRTQIVRVNVLEKFLLDGKKNNG